MKKKLTISLMICFLTIAFCLLSGCTSTEGEQTSLMQASMIKAIPKTEESSPTVVPTEEVPVQPVYAEEETYVGTLIGLDYCPKKYADKETVCVEFEDGRQMKLQFLEDYLKGGYPNYKETKTTIIIVSEDVYFSYAQMDLEYKIHLKKLEEGFWLMDGFEENA